MDQKSSKLWGCGGRFSSGMAVTLSQLNNSLSIDKRLFSEDIFGSLAYAEILCDAKILTFTELELIRDAFKIIRREWESGDILLKEDDEDIHSVNERRLTEIIGDVGRKIHTGRSRNDQVALDMKLWMKTAIGKLIEELKDFLSTLIMKSESTVDILLPGYTHLQRAQPIRFAHFIMSYAFSFQFDCDRLKELRERVNSSMPLGSGAIAGNPFEINREKLAKLLNFNGVSMNSMNAVSNRDDVVEFNFISTMIAMHLSRMAEDLILYATKEFNFIKLSNEYCTGSSLMPQKFNPDCLELVRGACGGICGQLMSMIVTLKALPSTYNKDLQNDKNSIFTVYDSISLALKVMNGVVETMEVQRENCLKALSFDMLATDLAYYLVRKGIPFRDAHHCASRVVDFATKNQLEINKVPLKELEQIHEKFTEDVYEIFNFEKSVEQYQTTGGTSRKSVLEQISHMKDYLNDFHGIYISKA